jgi:RNA polymerase sigma factor (sigma-70 family)
MDADFSGNPLESDSPEVWERLVQSLGPATMLVCIQNRMGPLLRGAFTPEDVWQDVLLHIWRDRGHCEWRGILPFRRWVLGIVENRIRNLVDLVKAAKRGGGKAPLPIEDPHSSEPGPPLVASTTPSRVASFSEQARRMRAALEYISADLRDVVRLRLFEEFSVEEVAEELGLGVSAVKHRFRRGAALYQRQLERLI